MLERDKAQTNKSQRTLEAAAARYLKQISVLAACSTVCCCCCCCFYCCCSCPCCCCCCCLHKLFTNLVENRNFKFYQRKFMRTFIQFTFTHRTHTHRHSHEVRLRICIYISFHLFEGKGVGRATYKKTPETSQTATWANG